VEKDRQLSTEIAGKYRNLDWFVAEDKAVRIAFDLLPKNALDYIRYRAVTIAGVENGKLLAAVKAEIEKAIREGTSLRDFRASLDQLFDNYGVTPLSNRHIDTVFRTNIFTAYSIGSQAQVEEMRDRFPLWRYSAILDSRTRPDHKDLNGNIYRVGEGPVPPIDYNCRCTAIYLHISQVERDHLESQVSEWAGGEPGFGDPNVRFNSRESFEKWKASNEKALNPEIRTWIDSVQ